MTPRMANPRTWRSRQIEIIVWTILAAATIGWVLFLFFQSGQPWDESEHAHAAWLISRGKKPIDDFFQHHQPLLWSLLALYYRVGFTGAGVLIWGRIVVVLSGLTVVAALHELGRSRTKPLRLVECFGCTIFIGLTAFLHQLFVIRPETIAAGLFLPALALWNAARGWRFVAIAGALAGAAVYTSPRVALLGGFFVLIGTSNTRRWLSLAAGGILFVLLYTAASGFAFEKVLFNLRFSSHLQFVGGQAHEPGYWGQLTLVDCLALTGLLCAVPKPFRRRAAALILYTVIIFFCCDRLAGSFRYTQAYAPVVIALAVDGSWIGGRLKWPPRLRGAVGTIAAGALLSLGMSFGLWLLWWYWLPIFDFLALVTALAVAEAWIGGRLGQPMQWRSAAGAIAAGALLSLGMSFGRWSQLSAFHFFIAFVTALAVAAAWIGGRLGRPTQQRAVAGTIATGLLLFLGTSFWLWWPQLPAFDLLASVRARDRLAAMVPAGETVLLFSGDSPITVEDASYYGFPLGDGQDRLCRAIRDFQSRIELPKCDFLKTLQNNNPYLTGASIGGAVSAADTNVVRKILQQRYQDLDPSIELPPYMRGEIVRRVSSGP